MTGRPEGPGSPPGGDLADETTYFARQARLPLLHRIVGFVFIFLGVVLLGASALAGFDLSLVSGALLLLVCGLLPYALNRYGARNPVIDLAVNRHGLWARGLAEVVPWAAIRSIRVQRFRVQTLPIVTLDLDFHNPGAVPMQNGPVAQSLRQLAQAARLDSPDLAVTISTLHEPPEQVVGAIERYFPVERES